ncbi:MAG: TlpA family protein disulfide reductase [Chloroflexi bacterium]|nr:TlpA family protein disulfide reductase [Chloroflexota bacterium]
MVLPHSDPPEARRGVIGPFTGRQLATAVVVVLAAVLVLAIATRPLATPGESPAPVDPRATQYVIGSAGEGLRVGDRAPELEIVGPDGAPAPLLDLDGNPVRLADLRGRPTWINFWASWCPPCQAETPTIRDVAEAYAPQGLQVVGISVQEATEDDVRAYAEKYDLGYTVAADLTGDVFRTYRVFGLPTQYFLDENGIIRSIVQGPVTPESAASNLALLGLVDPAASPPPSGSPGASR